MTDIPVRLRTNAPVAIEEHQIMYTLPANRYGRFLERPEVSKEIIDALNKENYIILVYGKGGIGKSALVYNIVKGIIEKKIRVNKRIDKVFWFSDADDPGKLTIQTIVSTIKTVCKIGVSTHSQPSLQTDFIDIQKEFENADESIIVIDNLDTIRDLTVWDFILKEGPRKCKFILTSQFDVNYYQTNILRKKSYSRELDDCVTSINVPKVTYAEWEKIFEQKENDVSGIKQWTKSMNEEHLKKVLKLVYDSLGGNVFGMNSVISILAKRNIAYGNIKSVINEEFVLRDPFERIAKNSWDLLSKNAQEVLVSAVLIGPTKLDMGVIYEYSRIPEIDIENNIAKPGSDLENSIIECVNLNLIDLNYESAETFYYINPFTYHFVIYKLKNKELNSFESIINRWINSYVHLARRIGFCFNDPRRMITLDDPIKRESLLFVLDYCLDNKKYWSEFISISKDLRYYFYTRAIWEEGEKCIHIKRANLAKKLGDQKEEFEALTYYINIAAKYHELSTVQEYIDRADIIYNQINVESESAFRFQHAKGLCYYASEKYEDALRIWDNILHEDVVTDNVHDKDAAKRWRLKCMFMLNSDNPDYISSEIIPQCIELMKKAKKRNMERSQVDYTLTIVDSYIILGDIGTAETYLESISTITQSLNDILFTARFFLYKALCASNIIQGREYIKKSTECFLSLKIKHELEYLKKRVDSYDSYKKIVDDMISSNDNL